MITQPCAAVGGGLDLGSPTGSTGTYVPLSMASSGGGLDGIPDVQYAQLIQPQHSRGKQYNARGDWYVTPHDQLAGTVYFTKLDNYTPSSATGSRLYADIPFKPLNSAATSDLHSHLRSYADQRAAREWHAVRRQRNQGFAGCSELGTAVYQRAEHAVRLRSMTSTSARASRRRRLPSSRRTRTSCATW